MNLPAMRRPKIAIEQIANANGEIAPTREGPSEAEPAAMDALGRLEHLRSQLLNETPGAAPSDATKPQSVMDLWRARYARAPGQETQKPAPAPAVAARSSWPPFARRLSKSALGLALLGVLAYEPLQNYFQTSSVEAIVNARTITLRSPIEGQVESAPGPQDVGASRPSGTSSIRIVDPSADPARVEALERDLDQLREDDDALTLRVAAARKLLDDLRRQSEGFENARINQMTVRREQFAAEADVAADRAEEAALTAQRATKLAGKGAGSEVRMEEARIEARIAAHTVISARKQVEAADIEIEALKRGIFVGDSYNDRPQSFQRASEVEREVADLAASHAQQEVRIARTQAMLNDERARYDLLAKAEIALPKRTLIYEVLTAPGERVQKGQDLLRLLDCSGAVVTAVVDESVYNKLRIGAPARFLPRGGGPAQQGRVIGLTGAAAAPANFAIQPSALSRGAFHVTVDIPGIAGQDGCAVGRTGRVIFDNSETAASAPL